TPQADALIAPELLSIMAGGAGSGLRMNEAEISRVIGGRSNWEALQAAANKWRLDPTTANSITPDQRTQIRALTNAVAQKIRAKQAILSDASSRLAASDDPLEHRRIFSGAKQALVGAGLGKSVMMRAPDGTVQAVAAEDVSHYQSLGATITEDTL